MWCKVTHCTGRASANTRPHQLRLGWPRDGDCYLMHVYLGGWSYPCCAVGSAGVTGSSHWKQLTNVCLVDHCHASAWKLEVEVIMHVLDHGLKINLVLGKGCNISLIRTNVCKLLKTCFETFHSCLNMICPFQSLTVPILCALWTHVSI